MLEVQVYRGTLVESTHLVEAVVMDASGASVYRSKGYDDLVFPRSCIKPMQALLLLESGGYQRFGLGLKHLSLACASHSGEDKHIEVVQDWLTKLQLEDSCLICGAHDPFDKKALIQLKIQGKSPTSLHNNCSGKHSGLLTYAKMMGVSDLSAYGSWDSKVQQGLRKIMSELTGYSHEQATWAMDGCGIPTYAVPLNRIANGLRTFFGTGSFADSSKLVLQSMQVHPDLTSGSDTFATRLMKQSNGRVILKPGAESMYMGLLLDQGMTFVLKAKDGAHRAVENVVLYFLQKYGGWSETQITDLVTQKENLVTNWAGVQVGKIVVRET